MPLSSLSSPSRAYSHLLEHDALGVRRPGERLLPLGAEVGLLVVLVGPQLRAAVRLELAPGSETARLAAMRERWCFFLECFWERRAWGFGFVSAPFRKVWSVRTRCGGEKERKRRRRRGRKGEKARESRSTAARRKSGGGGGRRSRFRRRFRFLRSPRPPLSSSCTEVE